MSERRDKIVDLILAERQRQFNLPGSEWDMKNAPNDWIAIAASYLAASTRKKHTKPTADGFEDDLIKAAAVILAALEHVENMRNSGTLR